MPARSTFETMREDEREARKNHIFDAALKLFEKKSFNEIGMRDIASEAGISVASIYRYFPSRDDLLVDVLMHNISAIVYEFENQLDVDNMSIEEFSRRVVDYLIDNEATYRMIGHLITAKAKMNRHALEKFNQVHRAYLDGFDRVLKRGGIEVDLRLFSHALFSSLAGVVMMYRNYPGRNQKEIRTHIHRLAMIVAKTFKCVAEKGGELD